VASKEERETAERFSEQYGIERNDAARTVERAVIGGDWGANGYTTMAQADLLGAALELRSGRRLLDIGSGRGWPGLYLAGKSGCDVVLSDVPIEGLRQALTRAEAEGLETRVEVIAAGARDLPFPPAAFDAIVHTDVLC
jgi:tRNA1(Val) A37 N6-methylase TrmN6